MHATVFVGLLVAPPRDIPAEGEEFWGRLRHSLSIMERLYFRVGSDIRSLLGYLGPSSAEGGDGIPLWRWQHPVDVIIVAVDPSFARRARICLADAKPHRRRESSSPVPAAFLCRSAAGVHMAEFIATAVDSVPGQCVTVPGDGSLSHVLGAFERTAAAAGISLGQPARFPDDAA